MQLHKGEDLFISIGECRPKAEKQGLYELRWYESRSICGRS